MTSDDSPRTPLGLVVDKHLKNFEIDPRIEEHYPMSKALASWYLLNHHLISNRVETEKHFHEEQLMSYHLLYDWWTAAYQDTGISLSTILDIVSQSADLEQLAGANWSGPFASVLNHLAPRKFPEREDLLLSGPLLKDSRYDQRMRILFHAEFNCLLDGPSFHQARQDAIAAAYTQRAAVNCFTHGTGLKTYSSITTARGYPIISSPMLPLDHGPSLERCVWLPPLGDKSHCIPYYLWDVAKRETVHTNTFTEFPSYTCISHTWGRWRLDSKARVEGVWWSIPRNSKFEVETLPSLLSNVPTRTPYVWLDLLCIPQDGSNDGAREIARQGEIFRAAQHAIIWLNDVDELDALSNIAQWMVLAFLQISKESEEQRSLSELRDQAWKNLDGKSTNLFACGPFDPELDSSLNPWFTSLWTLQEVCLRPDMWLCARDWSLLSIDGETALPLDGLLCIQDRFESNQSYRKATSKEQFIERWRGRPKSQGPHPFDELQVWRSCTGFDGLLQISRVGILTLGDRRHCMERRAEAIMSVLGVTEWYRPGENNDRELVLGKYPLAFLKELKHKNPGQFFSNFTRWSNLFGRHRHRRDKLELDTYPGSLLPFGIGFGNCFQDVTARSTRTFTTHPSLASWTIDSPDGHVHIERACIISPPRKALGGPEGVFGAYFLPQMTTVAGPPDCYEVGNLHTWVRSSSKPIYCVATQYWRHEPGGATQKDSIQMQGVILGMYVEGKLFKIGSFVIFLDREEEDLKDIEALAHYLSSDEEVNWTVS